MILLFSIFSKMSFSQNDYIALKAPMLFDGESLINEGTVIFRNGKIVDFGSSSSTKIPNDCKVIEYLSGTIMPGMIEGHAHMLLHPYDEVPWNDQILFESIAERSIRAANHAAVTLEAGFTTVRDLGSEGAGYADVGLKQAIEKGIVEGPNLIVAGPAIVATGSYGPKGFRENINVPLGAHEADGIDGLIKEVRRQIGGGADFIKVYADYRWGPDGEAQPTFTLSELKLIVEVAKSSNRDVVAHASTEEGMRRATLAGVISIEHGDGGSEEVFELMKEHNVALCPTLAAGDAISQYKGWKKGIEPDPERIKDKKKSFALALSTGVKILAGGDVGVFTHGDNVRELEMMVEYGMDTQEVLKAITSANAKILGINDQRGLIKKGMMADIIVVDGNPTLNISDLRKIKCVIKGGKIIIE